METNNNAGEGRPDAACSALADLLGNLDEWATHYRELGSPVTLSILRARKTLADQSDRIGELLQAVERGNKARVLLARLIKAAKEDSKWNCWMPDSDSERASAESDWNRLHEVIRECEILSQNADVDTRRADARTQQGG